MPTYTFKNTKTGKVFEEFMSIAAREQYLADNPHITTIIETAPALGDPVRLGLKKPDDGFRDVLRKIKAKHKRSNINTF